MVVLRIFLTFGVKQLYFDAYFITTFFGKTELGGPEIEKNSVALRQAMAQKSVARGEVLAAAALAGDKAAAHWKKNICTEIVPIVANCS